MDPQLIEFERLKLLFDYTKFHIGLYATLIAALVAARESVSPRVPEYLKWTLLLFLIAGGAGGVVASNAPDFSTYSKFLETPVGPFGWKPMPALCWIHLEHLTFWAGIVWACLNAIVGPRKRESLSTGFGQRPRNKV
jgi:hypothetical protein